MPRLERYGAEISTSNGRLDTGTYHAVEFAGGRMTAHPYRRIPRRLVQMLVLSAVGVPRDGIPDVLGITRRTVDSYLSEVAITLNTRSTEHAVNRCFDDDVGVLRPVPGRPARIPAGAQVDIGIIGSLAYGKDESWIAEASRRCGIPVFAHQIRTRIDEITDSFGVEGMPAVISVCRMAGLSFAPPA